MAEANIQSVQYPKEMTPEDIAGQEKWEAASKERRAQKAALLSVHRSTMRRTMVLFTAAIESAFDHGDPVMLEAAQEETLRMLDVIRTTIRSRA